MDSLQHIIDQATGAQVIAWLALAMLLVIGLASIVIYILQSILSVVFYGTGVLFSFLGRWSFKLKRFIHPREIQDSNKDDQNSKS